MAESTIWWIAAGAMVALELFTGTFYLLMLSIGVAAGGLVALAGGSLTTQLIAAALVGGGAVLACYFVRRRRPGDPSPRSERSVNLDIGETVEVPGWNADGTANIRYRGAQWTVIHRPGAHPVPGTHKVVELVGSRLLVEPVKSP